MSVRPRPPVAGTSARPLADAYPAEFEKKYRKTKERKR
jgi:hypothetical protein